MAKTHKPVFTQAGRTETAVVTAASADLAAPAGAVELCQVGAEGSLLVALRAMPRASATATVLALYQSFDDGTTKELIGIVAAGATEPGGAVAFDITADDPKRLDPGNIGADGNKLYVAAVDALAGGWVFEAQVENY